MKVHVKRGEYQSAIPGIIATIAFLSFSIMVFAGCFLANSLMEVLSMELLFALVFFSFSLYFVYLLLKKPKRYSAKLIKKSIENYKGRQITYMKFVTKKRKEQEEDFVPKTYTCYTYGNNDLIEKEKYIIRIKEFNWKIKSIEEDNDLKEDISKVPNMTLFPVFLAVGFIFGRTRVV